MVIDGSSIDRRVQCFCGCAKMHVKLSFVDRDVPRGVAAAVAGGGIWMGFLRSKAHYWCVRFWWDFFSFFSAFERELETWERDDNDYDQCDEEGG